MLCFFSFKLANYDSGSGSFFAVRYILEDTTNIMQILQIIDRGIMVITDQFTSGGIAGRCADKIPQVSCFRQISARFALFLSSVMYK